MRVQTAHENVPPSGGAKAPHHLSFAALLSRPRFVSPCSALPNPAPPRTAALPPEWKRALHANVHVAGASNLSHGEYGAPSFSARPLREARNARHRTRNTSQAAAWFPPPGAAGWKGRVARHGTALVRS